MRIKLHFELENNIIPKDYRILILSFIKNNLEKNFNEILKLCQWDGFDILGHLTYALRYIEGEQKIKVDMEFSTSTRCYRR